MPNLREIRRRLRLVLVVLLLLDVAAVAALLLTGSPKSYLEEQRRLRNELQSKQQRTLPASQVDEKLEQAREEIRRFYQERLPERQSEIAQALGDLATEHGVTMAQVKYDSEDADQPGLRRVKIDAEMEGEYVPLMKFINGLERSQTLFIIQGVSLAGQQGGRVRLQLSLESYLQAQGA